MIPLPYLTPRGQAACRVCAGNGLSWAGPFREPCPDCHPTRRAEVPCICTWRTDGGLHAPRCPRRTAA